ncbi:MAG: hypothetical protein JW871_05735 [Endomicrobiales bacterium]|nr:hypothetical protein [Endomicrobiales bacterium]
MQKPVKLVNYYFTPFAIALIVSAAVVSTPGPRIVTTALLLVLFSFVFNLATAKISETNPQIIQRIINFRLITNYLINIVLVYILIGFWGPMWLLFVLTPVATALYENTTKTAIVTFMASITLFLIYILKGISGSIGIGQALTHVVFIIVLSFFVHSLVKIKN